MRVSALNGAVEQGSGTAKPSGAQLSAQLWLFLSCFFVTVMKRHNSRNL